MQPPGRKRRRLTYRGLSWAFFLLTASIALRVLSSMGVDGVPRGTPKDS
jgi:hypothetical protein